MKQEQIKTEEKERKKWTGDVTLVEFMYLVFTRVPGESYRKWLRSLLLYLCHVFRALIISLVFWLKLSCPRTECRPLPTCSVGDEKVSTIIKPPRSLTPNSDYQSSDLPRTSVAVYYVTAASNPVFPFHVDGERTFSVGVRGCGVAAASLTVAEMWVRPASSRQDAWIHFVRWSYTVQIVMLVLSLNHKRGRR